MDTFAIGVAELLVILIVSAVVAAAVGVVIALVFAWGRRSSTTPKAGARTVESRLQELEQLRRNGSVTDDEYRERRSAILERL